MSTEGDLSGLWKLDSESGDHKLFGLRDFILYVKRVNRDSSLVLYDGYLIVTNEVGVIYDDIVDFKQKSEDY